MEPGRGDANLRMVVDNAQDAVYHALVSSIVNDAEATRQVNDWFANGAH